MLIVHVITRLLRAGSEENTIATCLAQAEAGHQVMLIHGVEWSQVTAAKCGSTIKLMEINDLVHPINPIRDFLAVRALRRLFEEIRPTVVHTHQSKAGIVGRLAAKLANVPYVIHGVHILPFVDVGPVKRNLYLALERTAARFTSAFINVSEGMKDIGLSHAVGRPEQHFVARSGMQIRQFRTATPPQEWRSIVGVSAEEPRPPIILMLAALEQRKRHVEFLSVFAQVVRRIPNVRLLIAGEGGMRTAVAAAISKWNLTTNVRLLGFHAHPEQLIALSDLTVLTSMREGLPRVVVQSLAGGTPVVTTRLPGIDEIVHTGINGIVTAAEDLAGTADAIADLMENSGELAKLRAGALSTDVSAWDIEFMCRTISEIYQDVMHVRPNNAPRVAANISY